MTLKDKVFLITGGASGLGRAAAQALVDAGANAVLLDLNSDAGQATASALGHRVFMVRADVTSEADVLSALDVAVSRFGAVHGVVNAAGICPAAKVLGKQGPHALDLFESTVRVNLVGTFNVIRLTAARMALNAPEPSGERGVIINTASIAAYEGQIGQAGYASSKAGIVGLTLPVAREFASLGIRVVTIAPGIFDTPLLAALPEAARQSLGQQVPFPSRLGQPEEYGALVRHIVENVMLNGEVIRLDGALRMAPR